MNMLNQSPGNGSAHSVFPASSRGTSRPSCSPHPQQYGRRRQHACHRRHLLPVALTLPPPASNTLRYCSVVQPSRSSCIPAAPAPVGDSNGGSPGQRDEPLLKHRSADHDRRDYAVANNALQQGRRRRRVSRIRAVLGTSSTARGIGNHQLPPLVLQLDGGNGATEHYSIKHPAEPATTIYSHHHLTGEEEVKRKESSSGDDVELAPRTTGSTLGFVRSLMDDDRYLRLTQDYYHDPGSHLDRQRRHQQLLFPGDHHEEPPRGVTLAVSVSSAVKLEGKQMDQIAKKMRKLTGFENLRMENTVDPSLIAGFVIRYGEDDAHVIDLSVKGRLAEMEARLQSSDKSAPGADGGWSFPDIYGLDS